MGSLMHQTWEKQTASGKQLDMLYVYSIKLYVVATGVIVIAADGAELSFHASREVIVSQGVFEIPQAFDAQWYRFCLRVDQARY